MSAKVRVVFPEGEELDANHPVDCEAWSFADGKDFLTGLMRKAFPSKPGTKQEFLMSVEKGNGGLMMAISVDHRTVTVGPFNPSDDGFNGLCGSVKFVAIERKDVQKH